GISNCNQRGQKKRQDATSPVMQGEAILGERQLLKVEGSSYFLTDFTGASASACLRPTTQVGRRLLADAHHLVGDFGEGDVVADQKKLVVPMLGDLLAADIDGAKGVGEIFAARGIEIGGRFV